MKKYKMIINGSNVFVKIDDTVEKCGFYTTRFAESITESEAKDFAFSSINDELKTIILNNIDDPPKLEIEDIIEIKSFKGNQPPGEGFTWFKDE
jgi:hypothetical protein